MRIGKENKKLKDTLWIRRLNQDNFVISNLRKYQVAPYRGGCGTAALSMLTGYSPVYVDKYLPRTAKYWSDRAITSFLKERGYKVTEITINRLTQDRSYKIPPITYRHVLLVGQWINYLEGTWLVVNNGMKYHNFDAEPLQPMEFFNNPTDTVYVITHKRWE